MVLRIPPLRDRVDEILPMAEHFIEEANRANNMQVRGIEGRALAAMQNYDWPGNVRELKNVIERAVVIAQTEKITFADLSERVRQAQPSERERFARRTLAVEMPVEEITSVIDIGEGAPEGMTLSDIDSDVGEGFHSIPTIKESRQQESGQTSEAGLPITFKERMQRFEAGVMLAALERTDWNQSQAATLLHMPLRTLVYKLRAYNLSDSSQSFADPDGHELGRETLHQSGQIVFKNLVQSHEATLIRDALSQSSGNKTAAARLLQIPLRTLTAKIAAYDL
jgi:DNA-binding NtrC family response regulator